LHDTPRFLNESGATVAGLKLPVDSPSSRHEGEDHDDEDEL
jgi:hypothetical protein